MGICRNASSCLIQSNSTEVEERALYSASVEDRDTVCCFFLGPRYGI